MKIDVGRENSGQIELHVDDHGFGPPVLLLHGWPVSSAIWEHQVPALLAAGRRVVTYDRRGFGRSSRAGGGYDGDTLADDLQRVLTVLDLRECALVGYAMGCGELARYLGNCGGERVRQAVFIAPVPPFLPQGADDPAGLSAARFDGLRAELQADRHAFLEQFLADACRSAEGGEPLLGAAARRALWIDAIGAGPPAALGCLQAWQADFRDDLPRIGVPSLVLQGASDRILPPALTGVPLAAAIEGSQLQLIEGAPHTLLWSHADAVNRALVAFLD